MILFSAETSFEEDVESLFAEGMQYLNNQNFLSASMCFQKILSENPCHKGAKLKMKEINMKNSQANQPPTCSSLKSQPLIEEM